MNKEQKQFTKGVLRVWELEWRYEIFTDGGHRLGYAKENLKYYFCVAESPFDEKTQHEICYLIEDWYMDQKEIFKERTEATQNTIFNKSILTLYRKLLRRIGDDKN